MLSKRETWNKIKILHKKYSMIHMMSRTLRCDKAGQKLIELRLNIVRVESSWIFSQIVW